MQRSPLCRSWRELSNGGELRDVEEEFSEYVRHCYGLLFKFSFFKRILAIQTHIYLQNLASIQPRTSPVKLVGRSSASGPRTNGRRTGPAPAPHFCHWVRKDETFSEEETAHNENG